MKAELHVPPMKAQWHRVIGGRMALAPWVQVTCSSDSLLWARIQSKLFLILVQFVAMVNLAYQGRDLFSLCFVLF